jgi:hypothetical protein
LNSKVITSEQTAPSTIYVSTAADESQVTNEFPNMNNTHVDQNVNNANTCNVLNTESSDQVTPHKCSNSEEIQQPLDTPSPSDFFKTRKITTVSEKAKKKRKFVPPFLAGNLTKKANIEILETAHNKKLKPNVSDMGKTKDARTEKRSVFKKSSTGLQNSDVPSTSGLQTSRKVPPPNEDVDSDDFTDDDDNELCCVCEKSQPVEMKNAGGIFFVKWGKCDFCPHWTHLRFCTDVSVLRTHSIFRCPHCTEK